MRFLIHVTHEGKQPQALEEAGIDGATEYRNQFSGVPKNVQWKPLPNPKPLVEGPHVAIVKGPPGEEIYVDEFGRVKVKFPWDRAQTPEPSDESERTCWIRVSSSWAGAGQSLHPINHVWCSSFANWVLIETNRTKNTNFSYIPPNGHTNNPALAINFVNRIRYPGGKTIPADKRSPYGAILIIKSQNFHSGHAIFVVNYIEEDGFTVVALGGNQDDHVQVNSYKFRGCTR